jgi:hypothetical protein
MDNMIVLCAVPTYSQIPLHLRAVCNDIPERRIDGQGVTVFTDFGHFIMCFRDMLSCSNNEVSAHFTDYVTNRQDIVVVLNDLRFTFDDQGTFHGVDS